MKIDTIVKLGSSSHTYPIISKIFPGIHVYSFRSTRGYWKYPVPSLHIAIASAGNIQQHEVNRRKEELGICSCLIWKQTHVCNNIEWMEGKMNNMAALDVCFPESTSSLRHSVQGMTFLGAGERYHQVQLHHSCLTVMPGCSWAGRGVW